MSEIFSDVVEHVIPQLEARSDAPEGKLQDDVRIVFWFDN